MIESEEMKRANGFEVSSSDSKYMKEYQRVACIVWEIFYQDVQSEGRRRERLRQSQMDPNEAERMLGPIKRQMRNIT